MNVAVFFTWIVLTKVVTGHLPHVVTEDTSLVWSFHEEDLFQNDEAVENEVRILYLSTFLPTNKL